MHIWTISKWTKTFGNIGVVPQSGMRLRFDKGVDPEVKRACREFTNWLRKKYCFPVRVPIYVKESWYIRAQDKDLVYGIFFRPNQYDQEPYISISTGDYAKMEKEWGRESALTNILKTIAHELTHYFQWINDLQLTERGEERQAKTYANLIIDEYAETREQP